MKGLGRSLLAVAVLTAALTRMASADLAGTTVSGTLATSIGAPPIGNLFDPAFNGIDGSGYVPSGFLNSSGPTVAISTSQVEFAHDGYGHAIQADFGADTLLITDTQQPSSTIPMVAFFYDPAFVGLNFAISSDTFPTGTSISHIFPDQISIEIPDRGTGGSYSAVYTLLPVPEPGQARMFAIAASVMLRRRRLTML